VRPLFTALFFLPAFALAQTSEIIHNDPSRGATLMPVSVAWSDDATATSVNPAGLDKTGALELFWAHERSIARDRVIDGLFFAGHPVDALGLGLSIEWIRNGANDVSARKTGLGFGFGGEALSIGWAANFFNGGRVEGLTSFDLGLQSRLGRNFSAGMTVKNLDSPTRNGVTLPRTWDVGVGVRLFGERITLGLDWTFVDVETSRLTYSARVEIWKGLHASLGFSHGLRDTDGLFFQGGLSVDLAHFGASYALGGATVGNGLDHLVTVRASWDKERGLPILAGKIAVVSINNLSTANSSGTLATLAGVTSSDRYLKVLRLLDDGAKDPLLKGIVLKVETSGLKLGRALELRESLMRLRAAGKVVVALILSADDPDYLIATAADHVFAVPEAMVMVDGLQSSVIFLGGTAEKLGVTVDVARVGAYKNSPDQFTKTAMSAEQKEAINAYLDTDVKAIEALVPAARQLTVEQWRSAVDEGLKSVKRAKELKLIDDVVSAPQLEERLADLIPGGSLVADYDPHDERTGRWGTPSRIAVIPVIGTIGGGNDGSDALGLTQNAGADTFIRNLDAAARDPNVAAIILRIDSPGGDGLASDMMYRAVLEAKRHKPVVASMGDVAASGGYYVAMGADEIFASPTTVTGSIGVFYVKPAVKGLGESLGAHEDAVSRGKLAGALDYWEPWDDARRASVQKWIDDFYDTFITEAATSRKTTKEAIDAVARGRVWSGEDAKAHGLVDTMGGLDDAISAAKQRAGVGEKELDVVVYGPPRGFIASLVGDSALAGALRAATASPAPPLLAAPLVRLGNQLGADLLLGTPGIQARLEYQLDVH
jgi:protease-4